jgi:peptidoglycan hydrolase-like protein with peptidoglycan-binding domain
MKNILYSLVILTLFITFTGAVSASSVNFSQSLGYGASGQEVVPLQQFLLNNGYLKVAPTGNFLSLTQTAVQAFQKDSGISQTGYFGPLTIAAANSKIAQASSASSATSPRATVAIKSVAKSSQTASVFGSVSRTIAWQTNNYPTDTGVAINLIKKTSDSPASYTLVRQIANNTPNNGQYTWAPNSGETGNNLYVEVGCPNASTSNLTVSCAINAQPINVQ